MHCEENKLLRILRLLSDEELIRLGRRAELQGDLEIAQFIAGILSDRSFKNSSQL